VRLAHVLCNNRDYGWRKKIMPMLARGLSLEGIADSLNSQKVPVPPGRNKWSAATVRKAYVS
jgi:hypothetical protein